MTQPIQEEKRLDFAGAWSYAPAPEIADDVEIEDRYGLFIDGCFAEPASGRHDVVLNPATGERLAEVARAGASDVDRAVQAADRAHREVWRELPGNERGKYLFRISRILQERAHELAVLETMDSGRPIRETRQIDLQLVAANFFYYAGWADKLDYAFPGRSPRSLGVTGQIGPSSFPLLMAAAKIAPALATGNTVVFKPAQITPLSVLQLAEIFREAGLPEGVVNIVTGDDSTGAELARHPGVRKVTFAGSAKIGKSLHRSLAGSGKRFSLQLGGKATSLLFEDAPLDQAVEGITSGVFLNHGLACCAGARLLLQESISSRAIQKLKDRMETLIVGDPLDRTTDIGPIGSRVLLEKLERQLALAQAEGATLYQPQVELPERGYWCPPTLLLGASSSHRIVRDPIFGPLLPIQTFRTLEEGIAMLNDNSRGFSGSVWTDKGSKALAAAKAVRAGVVWANTGDRLDPTVAYGGGCRESGIGREGGLCGLDEYLDLES